MNQQEQNTASTRQVAQGYAETKAFIFTCINIQIARSEEDVSRLERYIDGNTTQPVLRRHHRRYLTKAKRKLKELKIRRKEVVEMLKEVDSD